MIDQTGKVTKFPTREEAKKNDIQWKKRREEPHLVITVCKTVINTFVLKGNDATVTASKHIESSAANAGQKPMSIVGDIRSEDLWTKQKKRWLLKQVKILSNTHTVDGKPEGDGNPANASAKTSFDQGKAALIKKDYATAFLQFSKAADAGEPRAIISLGSMYGNGLGVAKDEVEAVKWYRKAADAGNNDAKAALMRLGK